MTRLCAAALLGISLTTAAGAATVQTARGPVTVETTPETVAVYDIAALDTLDALGVPVAGVPSKVYLPSLETLAATAEPVGTLFEPDLEALNALSPDLVIVGGRSATQLDATARVAPSIDMTIDGERLLEDARRRIHDYGTLFGKESEAAALTAALEADLAAARQAAAGKGDALVVLTNGPKISVYGPGSRFGWIHDELAIPPAVDDLEPSIHGEAVTFEFIAAADPDWLIVLDRAAAIGSGEQSAQATLDNALVRATTAWREGHVIYLPAADFYIAAGGARATRHLLTALTAGFSAD
ncbi:siderophore ABC transporter substrate-binding protein [Acuticoccus sp. 2012]|uniref:Siderophore ABC transporter substrate-binding protein n=2 Tax=Acuticoccus mangrovi TaxID=2796142 RepID=A0A934IRH8_9HYPH|nr:siderophore ABC transporter substrate-binding protein [Acuticoccus mangrovi]